MIPHLNVQIKFLNKQTTKFSVFQSVKILNIESNNIVVSDLFSAAPPEAFLLSFYVMFKYETFDFELYTADTIICSCFMCRSFKKCNVKSTKCEYNTADHLSRTLEVHKVTLLQQDLAVCSATPRRIHIG